jgi:hypothetical protein
MLLFTRRPAIMHQKLADPQSEVLKHLAYSSALALQTTTSFLASRNNSKLRKFSSIEDAILAADEWFAAQPNEFTFGGLKKLEQRSHKCVCRRVEYVE